MGIGFAAPSNMVRSVMTSLIKTGKVVRGWLGVSIQQITPELAKQFGLRESSGALVSEVMADSPAARARLQSGDVIVEFDGKPVESPAVLRNIVAQTEVGKSVKVNIIRDGRAKTIGVKISEQPKEIAQAGEEQTSGPETSNALAGVEVRDLIPEVRQQLNLPRGTHGVLIAAVAPDSEAAQGGLQPGDVIMDINRQPVRKLGDYRRIVGKLGEKESVLLLINRRGGKSFVVIKP